MELFSRLSLNDEESAADNNTYNGTPYQGVDVSPYHHADDTLHQENEIPSLQGLSLGDGQSSAYTGVQYNPTPTRCVPYPQHNSTYPQHNSTYPQHNNSFPLQSVPSTPQNNTANTGRCAPLPEESVAESDAESDAGSAPDVDMTAESLLGERLSPQSSGENAQLQGALPELHETAPTHTPAEHPAAPRLQVNNFYYGVPPELSGEPHTEPAAESPRAPRNRRPALLPLSLSSLAVAYLLHTARKDLQALWHADLAALEHESQACAAQYAANRCGREGRALPALADRCAAWAQCMARDNRRAYAARLVSAAALAGRLLDAFVQPLGARAVCLCVAVCVLWAWVRSAGRRPERSPERRPERSPERRPERSPERSAESPPPPRPHAPPHSRALTLAGDS